MYRYLWHNTKKAGKFTAKKTAYILFPWVIHYLTDKYQEKHHHVVVDTIFSLITIVLIASNIGLFYWFYVYAEPVDMNFSVASSEFVISGSDITYTVNYYNTSKKVEDVTIELITPDTFVYKSSNYNLVDGENNVFDIGNVDKFEMGELQVTGEIIGSINKKQRVVAVIKHNYHGRVIAQTAYNDYQINDSSFEVVADIPESILNNQEFEWSVHYKNNSDQVRKNVIINLSLPVTYNMVQAPEGYNSEKKQIILDEVAGWEENDINLSGSFSKAVGESDTLITVSSDFKSNKTYYTQSKLEDTVRVLTPRISLNSSVPAVGTVGESFNYVITCNNIGDVELTNVKVTATVNEAQALGLGLYPKDGSLNGYEASWVIPSIAAGTSQNVYLAITVPDGLRKQNLSLSMNSQATANIEDLTVTTYSQTSVASIKFNSTLKFVVESRYYDPSGAQLGYGPFPLKGDEITALRVFWNIQDFTNDLNNVTIYTTLPSQVEWTGITSVSQGAKIYYDPVTRQVTWHTSAIPAFAGPQGASFELRVWPNLEQIGKNINITNETYFSAADSYTNTIIHRNLGALKTGQAIE